MQAAGAEGGNGGQMRVLGEAAAAVRWRRGWMLHWWEKLGSELAEVADSWGVVARALEEAADAARRLRREAGARRPWEERLGQAEAGGREALGREEAAGGWSWLGRKSVVRMGNR